MNSCDSTAIGQQISTNLLLCLLEKIPTSLKRGCDRVSFNASEESHNGEGGRRWSSFYFHVELSNCKFGRTCTLHEWKGELTGTLTWETDTFLDLKYMHWIHSVWFLHFACLFIFKILMNRIMEKKNQTSIKRVNINGVFNSIGSIQETCWLSGFPKVELMLQISLNDTKQLSEPS